MTQSINAFLARPVSLVLMACMALLSSSCGLSQHHAGTKSGPTPPTPALHLAQMNFGRLAEFGMCTPPACPAVTPKTLAPLSHAPLPETRTSATAPFLDEEATIVPQSSQTTTAVAPAPLQTVANPVSVYFRFAEASLSTEAQAILDRAIAAEPDAKRISISGRTDNVGPANANERLAAARARAVHDYLRTRHPRLTPLLQHDAQGSCCYVSPNDTEQGRGLNRRVDVRISRNGDARP